jgi:hypothetical protein
VARVRGAAVTFNGYVAICIVSARALWDGMYDAFRGRIAEEISMGVFDHRRRTCWRSTSRVPTAWRAIDAAVPNDTE